MVISGHQKSANVRSPSASVSGTRWNVQVLTPHLCTPIGTPYHCCLLRAISRLYAAVMFAADPTLALRIGINLLSRTSRVEQSETEGLDSGRGEEILASTS
jgi:hypothetical protein